MTTRAQDDQRAAGLRSAENRAVSNAISEIVKQDPSVFFNLSANNKTYIGCDSRSFVCLEDSHAYSAPERDLALSIADEIAREGQRGFARQFTLGADVNGHPMVAVVSHSNQVMSRDMSLIKKDRFARTGDHMSV